MGKGAGPASVVEIVLVPVTVQLVRVWYVADPPTVQLLMVCAHAFPCTVTPERLVKTPPISVLKFWSTFNEVHTGLPAFQFGEDFAV